MTQVFVSSCRKRLRWLSVLSLAGLLMISSVCQSQAAIAANPAHQTKRGKRQDATKNKINGQRQKGIEGILVVTESGDTVQATNSDVLFNPASTLKLATTWMALHELGPQFTFGTSVLRDSAVKNGEVQGNLYVSSDDLVFNTADALTLARELNQHGIWSVRGKLIVSSGFHMNIVTNGKAAAKLLASSFYHVTRKQHPVDEDAPRLRIRGGVGVGVAPSTATTIATHQSVPMKDILKAMLCFSNNFVADNLGNYLAKRVSQTTGNRPAISGAKNLQNFLVVNLGIAKDEASFSSTSGLYENRITPQAEMKVLQALKALLANNPLAPSEHLTLADVLPVAGVDPGTLKKRFKDEAGTVIAKTGTLPDTDAGVTALVGEAATSGDGNLLFVIFEQGVGRASINTFRQRQEQIVNQIQITHGGARSFGYDVQPLLCHLVR
jgi:serine-type D-Ala-D-Ala carboxypeptidase/endopeptidase (penicillin-binding protein 4)